MCRPYAGNADHVHLFVEMAPADAIARLVQHIKGSSSHLVNHELESESLFRWQQGYGAFTVGRWDVPRITSYIQRQKQHHQEESLMKELENSEPG